MKRILLLLLPLAVACSQQPVEQPLRGKELDKFFSGNWRVYNVESGEYESNYWVIDTSGYCYLACDEGFNKGKPISDYYNLISEHGSGRYTPNGAYITAHDEDGYWNYSDYSDEKAWWQPDDCNNCASTGKFYYKMCLQPLINGWNRGDLAYCGTYIDSLDIWTNKGWGMEEGNVYSDGIYELHRMKR